MHKGYFCLLSSILSNNMSVPASLLLGDMYRIHSRALQFPGQKMVSSQRQPYPKMLYHMGKLNVDQEMNSTKENGKGDQMIYLCISCQSRIPKDEWDHLITCPENIQGKKAAIIWREYSLPTWLSFSFMLGDDVKCDGIWK